MAKYTYLPTYLENIHDETTNGEIKIHETLLVKIKCDIINAKKKELGRWKQEHMNISTKVKIVYP